MDEKKTYLSPSRVLTNRYMRIPSRWKTAFFTSFFAGLLCHIFVITNDLPVPDTLSNYYTSQDLPGLGRWFLMLASLPGSFFSLPAVNSFLALFYLSISAVILTEFFKLQESLSIILLCVILVTFPTTAATMGYMYTVDAYFLSILFICLAVYLTKAYKYGFMPGIVLLSLALGIYQAYITFSVLLVFLDLMLMLLCKAPPKDIGRAVLRFLALGLGGVILYLIIARVVIAVGGVTLSHYQGAQMLSSFSYSGEAFIRGVVKSYTSFGGTFLANGTFSTVFAKIMLILYFIVCGLLVLRALSANRELRRPWRVFALIVIIALTPIGLTIIALINPEIHYHFLMKPAYLLLFIFAVIFAEKLPAENLSRWDAALKWGAAITTAGLCFSFWLTTNLAYQNMHTRFEKDYGLCLRIVDRIEQLDDYEPGMPLYISDSEFPDVYPLENPSQPYLWNIVDSERNTALKYNSKTYNDFMREFLNVDFAYPGENLREKILSSTRYEEMAYWPSANSVDIIDGMAVVKMRRHENTAT